MKRITFSLTDMRRNLKLGAIVAQYRVDGFDFSLFSPSIRETLERDVWVRLVAESRK